ncbi:MAG: hypothetical protein ABIH03_08660 [Pseudomonadota bacterium]
MGIESATETGLKTAFQAFTNGLDIEDRPAYRCFWLDDESAQDTEPREYPLVQITAAPNFPTHHKATFRDVPVEVKFATHRNVDRKRAKLRALYEGCRAIIDTESTIAVSGYNVIGVRIEQGESGVDENEQFITLPLLVKLCGA